MFKSSYYYFFNLKSNFYLKILPSEPKKDLTTAYIYEIVWIYGIHLEWSGCHWLSQLLILISLAKLYMVELISYY